jgi:hypothetical protein
MEETNWEGREWVGEQQKARDSHIKGRLVISVRDL